MRIGYACLNVTLGLKMRTCRIRTVEIEGMKKVKELTLLNLKAVKTILQWNKEHGIGFFRVSSDIVPFGSHEILSWDWWRDDEVLTITNEIKKFQQINKMRLTVHPGQYTIINSPNEKVVKNAFRDLDYHNKLLNLIGGTDMVIHVGGVYGDKAEAKKRWVKSYHQLSDDIKKKLILENDDKSFHVEDVLDIHSETGVPVCFDIHHHKCNPYGEMEIKAMLNRVYRSWDGIRLPKMHISSGKNSTTDTAHHDYILKEDFEAFLSVLNGREVDLMFEAKKKEQAVLKLKTSFGKENWNRWDGCKT